jgi:hypothetical protein
MILMDEMVHLTLVYTRGKLPPPCGGAEGGALVALAA